MKQKYLLPFLTYNVYTMYMYCINAKDRINWQEIVSCINTS